MDKKTEDFQVENMLENWQKKPLDQKALLAAQDRVWSKLSSSLQLNSQTMLPENQTQNLTPKHSKNTWFLKPLNLSLIAFSLVVILAGAGSLAYLNQQNQKLSEQLALQKEVQNNPTSLNPVAKTDLSVDQIKGLATQKLNALTNGVPLAQIESTIAKKADASDSKLTSKLNASQNTDTKPTEIADKKAAETLVKEKGITDKVIYYTETLNEDVEPGYSYGYLSTNPNYSKNKPVKTQSWVGSNYSKYITSQDDKILSYNIYAIDYSVDFRGGKYAIKENYDKSQYLGGFTEQAQVDNSELSWLKGLLSDRGIKDEGIKQINGKDYRVLSTDPNAYAISESVQDTSMPAPDVYTTKYYIDLAKFTLFKTESYTNNKLVTTSTQLASQEIQNPDLNKIFSPNDLKVEVKEVQSVSVNGPYKVDLVGFSNKYDLLYPDYITENNLKENLFVSDASEYNELPVTKLRNTIDFDPGLDEATLNSFQNPMLASYNFQSTSFAIYKDKPNYLQKEYIVKTKDIKIKLNNKPINATYQLVRYNLEYDSNNKPKPFSTTNKIDGDTQVVTFNNKGLWYDLNYFTSPGVDDIFNIDTLNLVVPSSQAILNIENYQKARDDSYPKIEPTSFDDIKPESRFLPGDLSKIDKLTLTSVNKSTRSGDKATCFNFPNGIYGISDCLQEKYNGFSLNYASKSNEVNSAASMPTLVSYLNIAVLDQKIPETDLKAYVDSINKSSSIISDSDKITYSNKNEIITISNPVYGTYVYIFNANNRSFVVNSAMMDGQLVSLDKIKTIVKNIALDKDIEILKSQIKEFQKFNGLQSR